MTRLHQYFSSTAEAEPTILQTHILFYVPDAGKDYSGDCFIDILLLQKRMFIIYWTFLKAHKT